MVLLLSLDMLIGEKSSFFLDKIFSTFILVICHAYLLEEIALALRDLLILLTPRTHGGFYFVLN